MRHERCMSSLRLHTAGRQFAPTSYSLPCHLAVHLSCVYLAAHPVIAHSATPIASTLEVLPYDPIFWLIVGCILGIGFSHFRMRRRSSPRDTQKRRSSDNQHGGSGENTHDTPCFATYEMLIADNEKKETTRWSEELYRLLRRPPAAGTLSWEQYIEMYVLQEDQQRLRRLFQHALENNGNVTAVYRIRCQDGAIKRVCDRLGFLGVHESSRIFLGQRHEVFKAANSRESAWPSVGNGREDVAALLARARQDERKRLARDLHDDVGQLLAAIKLDLCDLQRSLPQDTESANQRVAAIQTLLTTVTQSVRRTIAGLQSEVLAKQGFSKAVHLLAQDFEARHHIICRLHIVGTEPVVGIQAADGAYHIVQEALSNVAAHADATRVDIRIDTTGKDIVISVSDNGIGMYKYAALKAGSFGLLGMRERAILLGGDLDIDSVPGTGTVIRIAIPKSAADAAKVC